MFSHVATLTGYVNFKYIATCDFIQIDLNILHYNMYVAVCHVSAIVTVDLHNLMVCKLEIHLKLMNIRSLH